MTNFGAFVELAEGIEGLIHVSEFDDSTQKGKDGKLDLQVGESYQMKIIKLIPTERKIGLSIRALKNEEFRADWEAYTETTGRPEVTLGDHFKHSSRLKVLKGGSGLVKVPVSGRFGVDREHLNAEPEPEPSNRDTLNRERGDPHEHRQHDESGARRGSLAGFGPHEEALRSHRRHGVQEHHRRAASRREDRARGFGSFRLRRREPRKGRNPKTGDKVDVPPKKVPYFKPGKELKELINREAEPPAPATADVEPDPTSPASDMEHLWSPWRLAYITGGRRSHGLRLLRRAR